MIVFAADLFSSDYVGGAELTLEALIEKCPLPFERVHVSEINKSFVDDNKNKFWIFGNTARMSSDLLLYVAKNLNYSIVECDYKFCKYRLPDLHFEVEKKPCDCENTKHGKSFALFHYHAKFLWWMSKEQERIWIDKFPFLKKDTSIVLSSVFSDKSLEFFQNVALPTKLNKVGIVASSNWVKGTENSIEFAKENNLEYDLIHNFSYDDVLKKISTLSGLVLMPNGGDTCPRIVIEAKLLGCKLYLNQNVQHQEEPWFSDKEAIIDYLKKQKESFWYTIQTDLLDKTLANIKEHDYRWSFAVPSYNEGERLRRFLKSCSQISKYGLDDIFIVNHRSDDNTENILKEMQPILKKCGIDLRWEYESRDFNKDFTMADLRMKTIEGTKNDLVHIMDADNIVGNNFGFIIGSIIEAFKSPNVYAAGYEKIGVSSFIEFSKSGHILNHGPVLRHVPIPRVVRKKNVVCKQNHVGGRYYWFYPINIENPAWVTVPFVEHNSILGINDKSPERLRLRRTMNDYFEKAAQGHAEKPWLELYEEGLLEKADISKEDYLHSDNLYNIDLTGHQYFV